MKVLGALLVPRALVWKHWIDAIKFISIVKSQIRISNLFKFIGLLLSTLY